jgi:hypothetical protein
MAEGGGCQAQLDRSPFETPVARDGYKSIEIRKHGAGQ